MLAVRERDDEDASRAHSAALTPTQPRGVCHVAKLLGAKPAEVGNGAELIYEVEDVEGKLPQGEGRFGVGVHNGHRDLAQFRSNRGADPRLTGQNRYKIPWRISTVGQAHMSHALPQHAALA